MDLLHAIVMVAWVVGLPLLFVHRWPSLSRAYGVYAIVFVVVSQTSQWLLGECFLTTLARAAWTRADTGGPVSGEWFTVRLAKAVFDLSPDHRTVTLVFEALIVVTAVGAYVVHRSLGKGGSPSLADRHRQRAKELHAVCKDS